MRTTTLTALTLLLILTACRDESTFRHPGHFELELGAYVRFSETPPGSFPSAAEFVFDDQLIDVNDNVSAFTIHAEAVIGGVAYAAENVFTATSFPADFRLTAADMAEAFEIAVDSIGTGDTFSFQGVATRDDGTVFYPVVPNYNPANSDNNLGFTDDFLMDNDPRDAMQFGVILACPLSEEASYLGDYLLTGTFTNPRGPFFLIQGATELEVELVQYEDSVFRRSFDIVFQNPNRPAMTVVLDFICGTVTTGENLPTRTGCGGPTGGPITITASAEPGPYDETDDSLLVVKFIENGLSLCGWQATEHVMTLTKL